VTDNYRIVPYNTQHGDEMIEFGLNDKLMDIDASFKENRIDFAMAGLAFTLLDNNVPICSGGIIPTWLGSAEGWVISSKRIFKNKIKAARLIRERTDLLCANNKIWRLQTAVKADFKIGVRFAEFLGFKNEGLMKAYGPDKTDYYRMARIYL
tara:strand:+ start:2573 stop:3028 length:456 start_codon:yes stop_codon:yes gene_type:complete